MEKYDIGAIKQWEGFGLDYFLPQGTSEGGCYSETCAAIGVMMLAQRLLQVRRYGICLGMVDIDAERRLIWTEDLRTLWNSVCTTLF
jgi:hypothetical protein